jgi:uncharacterized protein (TIGR00730 family)
MNKKERDIIEKELNSDNFRVTIFGSARIDKEDKTYKRIFELSKDIANLDIDLITGGGPGLMEAASWGHHEGKGKSKIHTIGLNIDLPYEQSPNIYLDHNVKYPRFSERLDSFMLLSNLVVVASGGIGTLLELMYTWQLIQVKHIKRIPIILMGEMWFEFIDWVRNNLLENSFIGKDDLCYIHLVQDNKEAIEIIKNAKKIYSKNKEYSSLNLKKYKI